MESIITEAILTALGGILVAVITVISKKIALYIEEKGVAEQLSSKGYLVDIAVNAAEQIWQNEDGFEKFNKAKQEALKLLDSNGLDVSDVELNNLIEASVKAMNDGFNSVREDDVVRQAEVKTKGDK